MIIEMFGPAGAGKTTMAGFLADALRQHGQEVRLVCSSRPAETASNPRGGRNSASALTVLTAPLSRAFKMVSALPTLMAQSGQCGIDTRLLSLFPQGNLLSTVRSRRYLAILLKHWSAAVAKPGVITIFDQAFLSSVCNLSMTSSRGRAEDLEQAVSLIPKPDLLVLLKPAHDVLKARLTERLARQSILERWLELDLATTLRQAGTVATLGACAEQQGWRSLCLNSTSWADLDRAVAEIVPLAVPAIEAHAV